MPTVNRQSHPPVEPATRWVDKSVLERIDAEIAEIERKRKWIWRVGVTLIFGLAVGSVMLGNWIGQALVG